LIVDTNILIDLERSGRQIGDLAAIFPNDEFAVAAITMSEVLVAAFLAHSLQRQRQREEFTDRLIQAINVIPFDVLVARQYAATWAELSRSGQLIDIHDLMIAATALVHGFAILTRNLRHFARIPGLAVQPFNV
jgi:tRNA(fMet)-specific endonuclease VapC